MSIPSDASTAAAPAPRRYSPVTVLICIVATWIVPGAGHWLLGRRQKALLFAGVLSAMFLLGVAVAEGRAVRADDDFFLYLLGQGLYAGLAFPILWMTGGLELASELPRLEVGRLFATIAGLMNLCVMVDVYETAFPRAPAPGDDAVGSVAAVAADAAADGAEARR